VRMHGEEGSDDLTPTLSMKRAAQTNNHLSGSDSDGYCYLTNITVKQTVLLLSSHPSHFAVETYGVSAMFTSHHNT
jgi:hypothetical protein